MSAPRNQSFPASVHAAIPGHLVYPSRTALVDSILAAFATLIESQRPPTIGIETPHRLHLLFGEAGIGRTTVLHQLKYRLSTPGSFLVHHDCALPHAQTLFNALTSYSSDTDTTAHPHTPFPTDVRQKDLAYSVVRRSEVHPLILLFDNLEFAGPDTIDLLIFLVSLASQDSRLFIVTGYSTDVPASTLRRFLDFAAGRTDTTTHPLPRIGRDELQHVLSHTQFAPHASTLSTALHDQTVGIPLLIHATLADLLETNQISPEGQSLSTELELAKSVVEYVHNKLLPLPAHARTILDYLSLAVIPLSVPALAILTNRSTSSIAADISHVLAARLIHATTFTADPAYELRHTSFKCIVVRFMSAERKLSFNARLANYLRDLHPDATGSFVQHIAHHYLEAMDSLHGPEYALLAADVARDSLEPATAISFLKRGIDLIPSSDIDRRFEGLRRLSSHLTSTGNLEAAVNHYNEMLLLAKVAQRPDLEPVPIHELSQIYLESGDLVRGIEYARIAERISADHSQASGEARALAIQAQGLRRMGLLHEASAAASRGYQTAYLAQDTYTQSLLRNIDGLICNDSGYHQRAIALFQHALELKSTINDRNGMLMSLNNIGLVYLETGQLALAKGYFERASSEARQRMHSLLSLLSCINLSEVARLSGDLSRSQQLAEESLSLAEASGRKQFVPNALYNLGLVELLLGRYSNAMMRFTRSEATCSEARIHLDLCLTHAAKARALLELGQASEARQEATAALALAAGLGYSHATGPALSIAAATGCWLTSDQDYDQLHTITHGFGPESCGEGLLQLMFVLAEARLRNLQFTSCSEVLARMELVLRKHPESPDSVRLALIRGRLLLNQHNSDQARVVLERGTYYAQALKARPLELRLLTELSRAQYESGQIREARESLRRGAHVVSELADEIREGDFRSSFLDSPECAYLLRISQSMPSQHPSTADTGSDELEEPSAIASVLVQRILGRRRERSTLRELLTELVQSLVQALGVDRGMLILHSSHAMPPILSQNIDPHELGELIPWILSKQHGAHQSRRDSPRGDSGPPIRYVTFHTCFPVSLTGNPLGTLYLDSTSRDERLSLSENSIAAAFVQRIEWLIQDCRQDHFTGEQAIVVDQPSPLKRSIYPLLGESPAMQKLFKMMDAVIKADCNVLLCGESGTGKELVARSIHYGGRRKLGGFVPVDCGAIPENLVESELFGYRRGAFSGAATDKRGLLEEADGGTLFLDEVTNTSLSFQAKLLRTLQSGEFRRLGENAVRRVDARIIAATNMEVESAIRDGRFREDLYYRLNVVTLKLPPLRDRQSDIPILAEYFARRFCEERELSYKGIGRGALLRLQAYAWPGNVRELEHAIQAALVVSGDGMVRRDALPEKVLGDSLDEVRDLLEIATISIGSSGGSSHTLPSSAGFAAASAPSTPADDEKSRIEDALRQADGDKSAAARILGWNRMRLYRSLRRHGIPYDSGRDRR